jgi:lipopolysaccharide transport system permease protein
MARLVEIDGPGRQPLLRLGELWEHRELVYLLALRDIKLRYSQTTLGVMWAVLQPLLAMLLATVLLARLVGAEAGGLPYSVFSITGFAAWLYFNNSALAAANSFVGHESMLTKVFLPRLAVPLAPIAGGAVDLSVALSIALVVMLLNRVFPSPAILMLPCAVGWLMITTFAVGVWLSALNVLYRDVRYILPYFMQMWVFASPVILAKTVVPLPWRYIYGMNPVVAPVDFTRWSLAGGAPPDLVDLISVISGVVTALLGIRYFRRVEGIMADVV